MTTLQKVEFALLFQKPIQDPSIKLRRSIAKSAAFCSFGTGRLHKAGRFRCQNVGRDDWLWHPKSPSLLKPSSQSPRIQLTLNSVIRMPISNKEGTAYGGPGTLWHIKSPVLPKAPSQSLRIQLALNSVIRMPVSLAEKHSKAKTGKLSPEFGFAEFWSFVPLQRKTQLL